MGEKFYCTRCNTRLYLADSVELRLCAICESGVSKYAVFCYFCKAEVKGKMGKDASRINSSFAHNSCLEEARMLLERYLKDNYTSAPDPGPAPKKFDLETIGLDFKDIELNYLRQEVKTATFGEVYGRSRDYSRDYIMELKDVPANLPESVYDITDDPAESKTVNIARRRIKFDG